MEFILVQYKKLISALMMLALIVLTALTFELLAFSSFTQFATGLIKRVESVFSPTVEVVKDTPELVNQPTPFSEQLKPVYAKPVKIEIESVGISADIIGLGVDVTGKLETPTVWSEVGWYTKSAMPGQVGNIILNGHYDTNTGAPAAFWQLKNAQVNDKVLLVDNYGKSFPYIIAELFYVDIQDPDRLKIFDDGSGKSELTLVTCGGVWIPGSGYSKRLVAKAYLAEDTD